MFEVRLATRQDANKVFDVARDFATSFELDRDTFDSSFQCLLEGQDAWLGVAHAPPGVVGYLLGFDHLTFFANGRVSWVEEVAVDKHWRRRGVGSTLIKRFERWARSRGSKLCALATRRAEPFYSAIGHQASATYFRRLL